MTMLSTETTPTAPARSRLEEERLAEAVAILNRAGHRKRENWEIRNSILSEKPWVLALIPDQDLRFELEAFEAIAIAEKLDPVKMADAGSGPVVEWEETSPDTWQVRAWRYEIFVQRIESGSDWFGILKVNGPVGSATVTLRYQHTLAEIQAEATRRLELLLRALEGGE
jgi:hypothetical protein